MSGTAIIKSGIMYVTVVLASVIMAGMLGNITSNIYVILYAMNQKMPLTELSEDYGMGMVSALVFISAFILAIPLLAFFLFRVIKCIVNKDYKIAMLYVLIPLISYTMAIVMAGCTVLWGTLEGRNFLWEPFLFPIVFTVTVIVVCFCATKAIHRFVSSHLL
jgi:hypothetical protein